MICLCPCHCSFLHHNRHPCPWTILSCLCLCFRSHLPWMICLCPCHCSFLHHNRHPCPSPYPCPWAHPCPCPCPCPWAHPCPCPCLCPSAHRRRLCPCLSPCPCHGLFRVLFR